MLKAVGIYGSPRKGGNTDLLLDSALKGCQERGGDIKRIYVRDLNIEGCKGCDGCAKNGKCVNKDDMQDIYTLLDDADVIILSSPIFFYSVTSQLKALIDRGQAMWWKTRGGKGSKKKTRNTAQGRGYLIAVGATRGKNLFECAKMTARYFFDALGMSFEAGCYFPGIESKGAIKGHPDALQQAYDLCKE
jgi:multimeric flavodoxin WrbA